MERWGDVVTVRPDPVAIWHKSSNPLWSQPAAVYHRSSKGGGYWENRTGVAPEWDVGFSGIKFRLKFMGFKHVGLFPEQAVNWQWFTQLIKRSGRSDINVLNLFAYTGGATVACALAGARVCHVDAAKGMVAVAGHNARENGCGHSVRFIIDDCVKFIQRELRRGKTYDAIILDPPSYGRGPDGEMWKIEQDLPPLLEGCRKLLSKHPVFILLNCYTTLLSPQALSNVLHQTVGSVIGGHVVADEIGLLSESGMPLPCGTSVRWTLNG